MVIPQRFPHPSGADLGDNYISGLSDNSALQREFDDRFMSNGPGVNNNHSPSILRPFTGRFDTDLKQDFWTPHKQEHFRNPLIRRLDSNFCNHPHPIFGSVLCDHFRPSRVYLKQWHPRAVNVKQVRQDRFKPLSKHPTHKGNTRYPAAIGLPTVAENKLLFGSTDGKADPLGFNAELGDTEKPASDVILDMQGNNFVHKPQGEPITDSVVANWDLWNGVADP